VQDLSSRERKAIFLLCRRAAAGSPRSRPNPYSKRRLSSGFAASDLFFSKDDPNGYSTLPAFFVLVNAGDSSNLWVKV
jgi:hypothetical protein